MIHCEKCKTVNPPDQRNCMTCHRDLLPGTSFLVRVGVFIISLAVSGFAAWFLWQMSKGSADIPDLGCALSSPLFWLLLAIGMPFFGLIFLVKRTPIHERYLERAKRHINLDRDQALADMNEAFRLAPEKARASVLKERAKLLDQLGQRQAAILDKAALGEARGVHDAAGDVEQLFGENREAFIEQIKTPEIQVPVQPTTAIALGYCPACRNAVVLNDLSRCPLHPRAVISDLRLATPMEAENMKASIMEKGRKANRIKLVRFFIIVICLIVLCLVLFFKYGQ